MLKFSIDQRCRSLETTGPGRNAPFEVRILEDDLVVLERGELAHRAVVAGEGDLLVGDCEIAPLAVAKAPGKARLDRRGDEGGAPPGDPVHARISERREDLRVGPAPVEADHHRAVADHLGQLADHLGQAHRQPPWLAGAEQDRPPGLVGDKGV